MPEYYCPAGLASGTLPHSRDRFIDVFNLAIHVEAESKWEATHFLIHEPRPRIVRPLPYEESDSSTE